MRVATPPVLARLTLVFALQACGPAASAPPPEPAPAAPGHGRHAHAPDAPDHGPHADREPDAHGRFRDPVKWSKQFDNPKRDAWQRPEEVLRELHLTPDETVADVGAGTGYFTVRLARAVPRGRVLAVELEQPMVDHIRQRAEREGLNNVTAIQAAADDPKLPDEVDLVLLVNTYHHIQDREAYFKRVRPRLSSRGRLVIVDFRMGNIGVGPPDAHKISQHQAQRELQRAGYQLCRRYDGLPKQYMLVFAGECAAGGSDGDAGGGSGVGD